MAEFCLKCINKIFEINLKPHHVVFFSGEDICEECGEYKRCVARFNLLGRIAEERQYRKKDRQQ